MIWWVVLLKFVFGFVAVFFTSALVLSCIASIINPKINMNEKGEVEELGDKPRILFALIMSVAWAVVIAL